VLGRASPEHAPAARGVLDERRLAHAGLAGNERERAATRLGAPHDTVEVGERVDPPDERSGCDVVDSVAGAHPVDRTGPSAR